LEEIQRSYRFYNVSYINVVANDNRNNIYDGDFFEKVSEVVGELKSEISEIKDAIVEAPLPTFSLNSSTSQFKLPPNWEACLDDEGRVCFVNKKDNIMTYHYPGAKEVNIHLAYRLSISFIV
jgi:hypothetical protein